MLTRAPPKPALSSGSDPKHTYAKFSTGNKRTLKEQPEELGLDTRTALLEFHSTYYSANIMGLTILGRVRDFVARFLTTALLLRCMLSLGKVDFVSRFRATSYLTEYDHACTLRSRWTSSWRWPRASSRQ